MVEQPRVGERSVDWRIYIYIYIYIYVYIYIYIYTYICPLIYTPLPRYGWLGAFMRIDRLKMGAFHLFLHPQWSKITFEGRPAKMRENGEH